MLCVVVELRFLMEKNIKDVGKYVISVILILGGIVPVFKYLLGDSLESQPLAMLFAGLALIAVGVFALPEVLEKLDGKQREMELAQARMLAAN